jgi:hypothetical protein
MFYTRMVYIGYISKKIEKRTASGTHYITILSISNDYHCFYLPMMSSPATPRTKRSTAPPQAPTKKPPTKKASIDHVHNGSDTARNLGSLFANTNENTIQPE